MPEAKISHMPFSLEAFEISNLQLMEQMHNANETWKEGFNIWKEAFDAGDAGIYSVTVSKALDLMLDTIETGVTISE